MPLPNTRVAIVGAAKEGAKFVIFERGAKTAQQALAELRHVAEAAAREVARAAAAVKAGARGP